jgi:hypothetical protein
MCIIRGNVRRYLTGKKSKHTEEIIGASFEVATTELDTRARLRYPDFDTNTTRPYHLDHIIPLSLVQELDPKDQDDAVNNLNCLANLQWLEGVENLKKQDSVPWKTNDPFWNATPENCCF